MYLRLMVWKYLAEDSSNVELGKNSLADSFHARVHINKASP